jgi:hypothetical protein
MRVRWGRASGDTAGRPVMSVLVAFLLGATVPVALLAVLAYAIDWA